MVLTGVATAAAGERPFASAAALTADEPAQPAFNAAIDFRYSPCHWQATFGFPDDKYKSLVGDGGELKYDFPQDKFADPDQFGSIIQFTLQWSPMSRAPCRARRRVSGAYRCSWNRSGRNRGGVCALRATPVPSRRRFRCRLRWEPDGASPMSRVPAPGAMSARCRSTPRRPTGLPIGVEGQRMAAGLFAVFGTR